VVEAHGDTHLEEISVLCSDTNKVERVPASAMFIFIGALPQTDWLADLVERDERGFILTGPDLIRDGPSHPKGLATRARSLPARDQCSRYLCGGRCAAWFGENGWLPESVKDPWQCSFIHQYLSKV